MKARENEVLGKKLSAKGYSTELLVAENEDLKSYKKYWLKLKETYGENMVETFTSDSLESLMDEIESEEK